MARTLILLRHADAAAARGGLSDHDRPLTVRGRHHAQAVGRTLAGRGLTPGLAISSDARRAVETLMLVSAEQEKRPQELIVPELYRAAEHDLLTWVRRSGGASDVVLMVGHNPSIEGFASWMAEMSHTETAEALGFGFPPATLAVFDIDVPAWKDFDPERAVLRLLLRPGSPSR